MYYIIYKAFRVIYFSQMKYVEAYLITEMRFFCSKNYIIDKIFLGEKNYLKLNSILIIDFHKLLL